LEFLTPHGSKIATTVAILSPLFAKNSRLGYFLTRRALKGRAMAPKALNLLRKEKRYQVTFFLSLAIWASIECPSVSCSCVDTMVKITDLIGSL